MCSNSNYKADHPFPPYIPPPSEVMFPGSILPCGTLPPHMRSDTRPPAHFGFQALPIHTKRNQRLRRIGKRKWKEAKRPRPIGSTDEEKKKEEWRPNFYPDNLASTTGYLDHIPCRRCPIIPILVAAPPSFHPRKPPTYAAHAKEYAIHINAQDKLQDRREDV